MARRWSFRAAASVRKARTPDEWLLPRHHVAETALAASLCAVRHLPDPARPFCSRISRSDAAFEASAAGGGVSRLVTALTSVLCLQPQRRAAPSPSGETELSRHPRHATAVDGDSDLPFPHTRDATTLLCGTAYDQN
jgi:hypothetical protein